MGEHHWGGQGWNPAVEPEEEEEEEEEPVSINFFKESPKRVMCNSISSYMIVVKFTCCLSVYTNITPT
jgi:hypothetical protein